MLPENDIYCRAYSQTRYKQGYALQQVNPVYAGSYNNPLCATDGAIYVIAHTPIISCLSLAVIDRDQGQPFFFLLSLKITRRHIPP
jgi:hypothetical protein